MSQRSKAVVAREIGRQPGVEEIEVEPPRHGEVTIRLAACGVCMGADYAFDCERAGKISEQAWADLAAGCEGRGVIIFGT